MEKKTLRDYGLTCFKIGKYQVIHKKQFYKILSRLPMNKFEVITKIVINQFNMKEFIGFFVIWRK